MALLTNGMLSSITLKWKKHDVDLRLVDSLLKEKYPHYAGNQAHSFLVLYFKGTLTSETQKEVASFWENPPYKNDNIILNAIIDETVLGEV